MYKMQKKFVYPIGHRLSYHSGRCKNSHGHEFAIIVGIKSRNLLDDDMVIDFSDFKKMVNKYLDKFDHGLMINKNDPVKDSLYNCSQRVIEFDGDPTAEKLSKFIYNGVESELYNSGHYHIQMDFVTVYENENSAITYTEEN